jgi:hypothetical protein
MKIDPQQLARLWIHSREEDHEGQLVFRTEDFDFPPARGRDGFLLNADGTMSREGPGADDRTIGRPGTWRIDHDHRLVTEDERSGEVRVYEIAAMEADRLALKRVG